MAPVLKPGMLRPGMHVANVAPWEVSDDVYPLIEVVGELAQRRPLRIGGFQDDDFALVSGNVMGYLGGQPDERAAVPQEGPRESWYPNARFVACCDWETDTPYPRQRDEITMLANRSFGILEGDSAPSAAFQGLQFACNGGQIYERAVELGVGQHLPTSMFLQEIPT
jgi:hypothetical protein